MISFAIAYLISLIVTVLLVRYQHMHNHVTGDHDTDGIQSLQLRPNGNPLKNGHN